MEFYSSFLFARPSLIEGIARIMDMRGTLNEYNASDTGAVADAIAIWMDWRMIGQDIHGAMGAFSEETMEVSTIR